MDEEAEAAVGRLIAKDEIVDLVHRYSYGVDHRRYDEVVELFTEDAWSIRPGVPTLQSGLDSGGCSDIPRGIRSDEPPQCERPRDVEDPDHASVRTSVYAWHQRSDGVALAWGLLPRPVVRLPEGWRIAARQLRTLGTENWDAEMHAALEGDALGSWLSSSAARDDPNRWSRSGSSSYPAGDPTTLRGLI